MLRVDDVRLPRLHRFLNGGLKCLDVFSALALIQISIGGRAQWMRGEAGEVEWQPAISPRLAGIRREQDRSNWKRISLLLLVTRGDDQRLVPLLDQLASHVLGIDPASTSLQREVVRYKNFQMPSEMRVAYQCGLNSGVSRGWLFGG